MLDYKKIIKNKRMRLRILRLLSFVPDSVMIRVQYWIKTGRRLNLRKPTRFTEKLQWYKLYYKNPTMIQCVDKYDVREYVKSKGFEINLIQCYGVYDRFEDISWKDLPDQFVIKDTLGSGGNEVIIVNDKGKMDLEVVGKTIQEWIDIDSNKKSGGREWPYYSGKRHRILIEKFLVASQGQTCLTDYKFFCFNGKVQYIYAVTNRRLGQGAELGIFDENMQLLKACRKDELPLRQQLSKPSGFERMKLIAEKLSEEFPEARIDLYEVDGKIYFGEITFFDGSGYMRFEPDSFDIEMGSKFELPELKQR